ncbi:MAG: 16S rRNA (uracil(1498)-N(3))-methyltransferase [Clostridia bacterium]|nr:16S rRNA (uracil(1498)-N(3))-methyltransferase [Clostridia bacterium]
MAEFKRFFVETIENVVTLSGEEFEHAKNVLRLGVGDEVILLDNSGYEYAAVISRVEKKSMELSVTGKTVGEKEPKTEVVLAFGYLKNADKNEFIVQKAVELGVSKIVAFSSEFSSAYMNANKLERLNKVSKEAAKQCLRAVAPTVVYCERFEDVLLSASDIENKLFACEFAEKSEVSLSSLKGKAFLVVGSEGGFSRAEAQKAEEYGFKKISLGKRILRAETAAVALCSVVAYSLGELGEEQ